MLSCVRSANATATATATAKATELKVRALITEKTTLLNDKASAEREAKLAKKHREVLEKGEHRTAHGAPERRRGDMLCFRMRYSV